MERYGVERLMVRCRECRLVFATALQVDRTTLEALVINDTYECPHCGVVASYVKADHFHHLVVGDDDTPPS